MPKGESISGILGILISRGHYSVKISSLANRKLDALQARVRLRTGKRVTKQSVLEDLVERALDRDEAPMLLPAPKYPIPSKLRRLLRTYPEDWGVETAEDEIDAILYGGER